MRGQWKRSKRVIRGGGEGNVDGPSFYFSLKLCDASPVL